MYNFVMVWIDQIKKLLSPDKTTEHITQTNKAQTAQNKDQEQLNTVDS